MRSGVSRAAISYPRRWRSRSKTRHCSVIVAGSFRTENIDASDAIPWASSCTPFHCSSTSPIEALEQPEPRKSSANLVERSSSAAASRFASAEQDFPGQWHRVRGEHVFVCCCSPFFSGRVLPCGKLPCLCRHCDCHGQPLRFIHFFLLGGLGQVFRILSCRCWRAVMALRRRILRRYLLQCQPSILLSNSNARCVAGF